MSPTVTCRDQHLLAWTDSAIYIFTPQTGQVLLWSEVKGKLNPSFRSPSPYPHTNHPIQSPLGCLFVVFKAKPSHFLVLADVVEVAVYRSELFCLYGDGHLSHLSLLSAERCVERLLRREAWVAAASVCCMFQHTIAPSRVGCLTAPGQRSKHCVFETRCFCCCFLTNNNNCGSWLMTGA